MEPGVLEYCMKRLRRLSGYAQCPIFLEPRPGGTDCAKSQSAVAICLHRGGDCALGSGSIDPFRASAQKGALST